MLRARRDWLREDVHQGQTDAAELETVIDEEARCINAARPASRPAERIGLALSGGGSRSATFCQLQLGQRSREFTARPVRASRPNSTSPRVRVAARARRLVRV